MTRTRRQFLCAIAGTTATGTLAASPAGARPSRQTAGSLESQEMSDSQGDQSTTAWRMYGANLANTNYLPDVSGPTTDAGPAWQFETGGSITAGPAVAEGRVYFGSRDGVLYALSTGADKQWELDVDSEISTTPAVVDGTVYTGTEEGLVYAVDAATGDQLWRFGTEGAVRSSPAVADGTVYVGSRDNTVYAIDATDGTETWTYETNFWVESSPAVVDGTVYVGSDDRTVYALSAESGEEQWTFGTADRVPGAPAVANGTVYVGSLDRHLYALDAETGDGLWRFNTQGAVTAAPAIRDGIVYVGSRSGLVYAIDGESGEQRWQVDTGRTVSASPAATDDAVYVASENGEVLGLDRAGGDSLWTFESSLPFGAAPAIADGVLYVGGDDQTMYRLEEGFASAVSDSSGDDTDDVEPADRGDSEGLDLRFLLLPATVAGFATLAAAGYYALDRAGMLEPVETASETYGDGSSETETAADTEKTTGETEKTGEQTTVDAEQTTADTEQTSEETSQTTEDTETRESTKSQIWKYAIADVLERSTETEKTALEDVVVTKHLDRETLESPVLVYEIESVRDDPATVRITEPVLAAADEESRPMGDSWTVEDDTLVYESVVDGGETATTLVGRPDCPTAKAEQLLDTPAVTVESTET